jgi:hypothetical protein
MEVKTISSTQPPVRVEGGSVGAAAGASVGAAAASVAAGASVAGWVAGALPQAESTTLKITTSPKIVRSTLCDILFLLMKNVEWFENTKEYTKSK